MSYSPYQYVLSVQNKYLAGESVVDCFVCKHHRRSAPNSWLIKCKQLTAKENYWSSEAKTCPHFCPDRETILSKRPKASGEAIDLMHEVQPTSGSLNPGIGVDDMGWAKYQEDILSRWVQDNQSKENIKESSTKLIKSARETVTGSNAKLPCKPMPEGERMSKLKEFAMASARPLPVIVLADISGSMAADGKIAALNDAIAEMIATFAEEDDSMAEIHVSVVTFGGAAANVHNTLTSAGKVKWEAMSANGRTPMGQAFTLAREMIEDKAIIPSRAYRPTVVLVSDGVPTDDWEQPLKDLLASERASKAMRLAMAIGEDADKKTLAAFLNDPEGRVFAAHEAREIRKFFRWVTMSVTSRSRSANPNSIVAVEPTDLDDFVF